MMRRTRLEKEGGREWGSIWGNTGMKIWAPYILPTLQCPLWPRCSSNAPVCSRILWLQHIQSVLSYTTATQIIVLPHLMSYPLTYWYEAVLEATSGHCLTPCISSTVSTGLPASALLAQHWGFGSSDCTVWKEFSSSFSPDLFLLVFLVKERASPLHVGAVSC